MPMLRESVADPPIGTIAQARPRSDSGWFYVWMAWACAFIAFASFAPTYWAPVVRGSFDGPTILHWHGLLFSAWTLLFIGQTTLAANGRISNHRALGVVGCVLALAMLVAGFGASINSIQTGIRLGFEAKSRAFSIVSLSIVSFFVVLVAVAVAYVKRPEIHKRLMLVATISILPPAFGRLILLVIAPPGAGRPFEAEPPPVPLSLAPNFLADLLLVVAIVHDWRTRGRPHPAYLIAGACLLVIQIGRVPLAGSAGWRAVTDWLLAFAA